ncbi:MAG: FHA domain-containing protein [Desulfurococcales archaeon]|nr:FHA domain-containing protein [Desulfurococcales archaeon]
MFIIRFHSPRSMSVEVPREAYIYRADVGGLRAPIYVDICNSTCSRMEIGEDFTVSRRLRDRRGHARIYMEGGRVVVEDLGSTNGTVVDGRVLRGSSEAISPGQIVRIGSTIVFSIDLDPSKTTIPRGSLRYIKKKEYERLKSKNVNLELLAQGDDKVVVRLTGEGEDPEFRYMDNDDAKRLNNLGIYLMILEDTEKMLRNRRDYDAIFLLKPLVYDREFMGISVIAGEAAVKDFIDYVGSASGIVGSSRFLPDDVRSELIERIVLLKKNLYIGLSRGWR